MSNANYPSDYHQRFFNVSLPERDADLFKSITDELARQQDQIDSAYRALTDMQLQLETMLAPHEPFTVANNRLAETIAQVQEEAEIARRVRQRIEADNVAAILSEPTATETNGTITPEVTEEDS